MPRVQLIPKGKTTAFLLLNGEKAGPLTAKEMFSYDIRDGAEISEEEAEKLYPEFAKVARDEGFFDIAESYELVAKVESTHAEILSYIYDGYKKNCLYKSKNKMVYRCSNCGHIDCRSEGWKKCPLCSLDMGYIAIDFSEIFENAANC